MKTTPFRCDPSAHLQESSALSGPKAQKSLISESFWVVTGKSLDSSDKGNVDKMSEKCRQNVRKMSEKKYCKHNFRTFFEHFFAYIWSVPLFGDPVQCSPVTTFGGLQTPNETPFETFLAISGPELQTRAPWTEVNLAQMTESCLAGVQKVFWAEGPRVSHKSQRRTNVQQLTCKMVWSFSFYFLFFSLFLFLN